MIPLWKFKAGNYFPCPRSDFHFSYFINLIQPVELGGTFSHNSSKLSHQFHLHCNQIKIFGIKDKKNLREFAATSLLIAISPMPFQIDKKTCNKIRIKNVNILLVSRSLQSTEFPSPHVTFSCLHWCKRYFVLRTIVFLILLWGPLKGEGTKKYRERNRKEAREQTI